MINGLCKLANDTAKQHGFHDQEFPNTHWLALIHSEVSEALEADRIDDWDNFKEELADICIRTFSLCGHLGIDLEDEIIKKMLKNSTCPPMHNRRY